MGESHGTCEETGKQHGGIPRYRGNGIYEKCGSELERPYPSPKGKKKAYKLGEIVFLMMGGSRRGNIVPIMTVQENAVYGKVPLLHSCLCREGKSERMSCRLTTPKKKFDNFKTNYIDKQEM